MKILVATKRTQGQRDNDFCFCEEGEPVRRGTLCSTGFADDDCGCRRSLVGVRSSKATTTAVVEERGCSVEELAADIDAALDREGWFRGEPGLRRSAALAEARRMGEIAARFPAGAVIEYRGGVASARTLPD